MLLVVLIDIAFAAGALVLGLCISISAVVVTLFICLLGLTLFRTIKPGLINTIGVAAFSSLLVVGYSLIRGCIVRWDNFRGLIVPHIVVTDIISNPWIGTGYTLCAALIGGLSYYVFLKVGENKKQSN
jgi:hypothetical protein